MLRVAEGRQAETFDTVRIEASEIESCVGMDLITDCPNCGNEFECTLESVHNNAFECANCEKRYKIRFAAIELEFVHERRHNDIRE